MRLAHELLHEQELVGGRFHSLWQLKEPIHRIIPISEDPSARRDATGWAARDVSPTDQEPRS